jgi:hypothetical protein
MEFRNANRAQAAAASAAFIEMMATDLRSSGANLDDAAAIDAALSSCGYGPIVIATFRDGAIAAARGGKHGGEEA